MAKYFGRLESDKCALFVCDLQQKGTLGNIVKDENGNIEMWKEIIKSRKEPK